MGDGIRISKLLTKTVEGGAAGRQSHQWVPPDCGVAGIMNFPVIQELSSFFAYHYAEAGVNRHDSGQVVNEIFHCLNVKRATDYAR
ncbi:hypothetical protein GCM10023116_31970 [Kistimonas scapharcae]|uniref:DNA-directed RNA polymerase n=1 Tax=Kistimonas scapharcae TaxID=1036133 RepID=A0ABP8V5V1_9GAMM